MIGEKKEATEGKICCDVIGEKGGQNARVVGGFRGSAFLFELQHQREKGEENWERERGRGRE